MDVVLTNVPLMCLREKIAAYTTLFGREPKMQVSGMFYNKHDQLLVINREFYDADVRSTYSRFLTVWVKEEVLLLIPANEVIARLKLC